MDIKSITNRVFDLLEQIRSLLESQDVRWLVFFTTVFFIMLSMIAGLSGLALLLVGIYIMYFVTFR